MDRHSILTTLDGLGRTGCSVLSSQGMRGGAVSPSDVPGALPICPPCMESVVAEEIETGWADQTAYDILGGREWVKVSGGKHVRMRYQSTHQRGHCVSCRKLTNWWGVEVGEVPVQPESELEHKGIWAMIGVMAGWILSGGD